VIENPKLNKSISSHIFDDNKNNFLKCLDYISFLGINKNHMFFIDDLTLNFSLFSSPNERVLEKLELLINYVEDIEKKDSLSQHILNIDYFYGNFDSVYEEIKKKYPLDVITNKYLSTNKIEKLTIKSILNIYGMEGFQYDECKLCLKDNEINLSLFNIGEFNLLNKYFNKIESEKYLFIRFELELCLNSLDIKLIKKFINSLYKTQFIDKMQFTYILLKADKREVTLKDIKKLIVTNPFTDGLKILMLAMKDEKNCSKEMYEKAIKKLFHIKYYYVEAILLYCKYLKDNNDVDYKKWLNKGKVLSLKHYYRYLTNRFDCLESGIDIVYDEKDYPLPEKLDYSGVIKEYKLL